MAGTEGAVRLHPRNPRYLWFRGETFVQVGQGSPAATRKDLLEAAQGLSDALGGPGGPPPEAAVVNIASTVRRTTIYHKRAIAGYESLAPGYEARFSAGEISGTVLFIEPGRAAGEPSPIDALSRELPKFETVSPGLFRAERLGKGTSGRGGGRRTDAGAGGADPRRAAQEPRRVREDGRRGPLTPAFPGPSRGREGFPPRFSRYPAAGIFL